MAAIEDPSRVEDGVHERSNPVVPNGKEYRFEVTRQGSVVVTEAPGRVVMTLSERRGPGRRPALVACDGTGQHVLDIERQRRFPLPRYEILRGDQRIGEIWSRSFVRGRHTIAFTTGPEWSLTMPLFSAHFVASSSAEGMVRVRMFRENIWLLAFDPKQESPELVAALATVFFARWYSW